MIGWRLARSLEGLRREVNTQWPHRSKASDGTIGDLAHAARPSDHNPNPAGVVRAFDVTADGIDADAFAERIRVLGSVGHRALRDGGVVIWDRRLASGPSGWKWRHYGGANPHTKHVHVSVGRQSGDYDSPDRWELETDPEDFMPALTDTEQRELLTRVRTVEQHAAVAAMLAASVDQRCARLEASVHGTDDINRGESIWWRVRYLYSEVLDNGNAVLLRRILAKFGAG